MYSHDKQSCCELPGQVMGERGVGLSRWLFQTASPLLLENPIIGVFVLSRKLLSSGAHYGFLHLFKRWS